MHELKAALPLATCLERCREGVGRVGFRPIVLAVCVPPGLCELLRKGPVTPLFQGHRLAQLLDCVIGIRARKLFELLVGVPLSVHTELVCGGIPFRGGLLQCVVARLHLIGAPILQSEANRWDTELAPSTNDVNPIRRGDVIDLA